MFRALFFLFFLFAVMWVLEINTPESFFKDESLVHNFDVKSLGSWAAKQHMQASVVLFYNNKSALSKSYLPTFAEAANQAANWTEFVKFYSFDCASNLIVCYKFGFQSPPLVKYFSAETPVSDFGQKIQNLFEWNRFVERSRHKTEH
ncbi:hypothetical protein M3Y97_00943200 [Aphelenchoides bicaudatus]|nr:hypothetical protein M3Y97_00943200 [Aphelenchoides bicaudatus]